jgi:hypothetical protein
MKFFQKHPVASLAATRAMLGREEAAIAALNESRAQRLAEEADPGPVAEIDEQIERHRRNANVLRDKIPQIKTEIRRQMAERQEQDRHAAIKVIAAKLKERDAKAAELEAAIGRAAELFAEISNMRLDKLWSFEPPYQAWGNYIWKPSSLAACVLAQLQRETRGHGRDDFYPLPTNMYTADPIAETMAKHTSRLLAELAKVELPKPVFENESEPDEPELEDEPEADEVAA